MVPTRTEKVRLVLDDQFSGPAARAAARTEAHKRELDGLGHAADRAGVPTRRLGNEIDTGSSAFKRGSADIDKYSGRLKVLTQIGVGLGPALVPAFAALAPAVTGVVTGLAGAAGAAAAAGLAFAGVGDALGALNAFQLEPSAANFEKLQQAMDELGPSGEKFVRYLDSIGGEIESLQRVAGDNMFPGMTAGLQSLMGLMPRVETLVGDLAERMGRLSADAGEALAGPEWDAFFSFLQSDAGPIFEQFARSIGNLALGFGNMMVAFAPLSHDFAGGMLEASRAFAAWSSDTSNFTEFIDYVRKIGPQVGDFMGSLVDAVVALTAAVAPWGSVVLPALTVALDLFTAIAGSPIGPALTSAAVAMLALNKAVAVGGPLMGKVGGSFTGARTSIKQMGADLGTVATTWATAGAATERESKKMTAATSRLKGNMAAIGKGAGVVGAIGIAATGAAEGVGLQNTAMLGLAGTMAGPWGAAAGAGVGLILDMKAAQDQVAEAAKSFASTLDTQTGALTSNSEAWVQQQLSADQAKALVDAGLDLDTVTKKVAEGSDSWIAYRESMNLSGSGKGALFRDDAEDAAAALDRIAGEADKGHSSWGLWSDATNDAGASAQAAVSSLNELTAAQQAQTQASLAAIDAGTAYGDALDKASKQAESAEQGFNKFTEAGRNNRTAMTNLIGSYNKQDAATKNSVKGYREARAAIAELGRDMGLSAERIRDLQSKLEKPASLRVNTQEAQAAIRGAKTAFESLPGEVMSEISTRGVPRTMAQVDALVRKYNLTEEERQALITLKDAASAGLGNILTLIGRVKGKTVTIGVNTGSAVSNVAAVQAVINSLSGKTVDITTVQRTVYATGKMSNYAQGQWGKPKADGGEVMGERHPYGDKVLTMLAPGEEVITNRHGEADRFRADRAAGRIPAYADGGTIAAHGYASGGEVKAKGWGKVTLSPQGWANMADAMGKHAKALDRHGNRLERSLKSAEKSVDKAKDRLDYWNDKRDALKSQVTGSLKRDWFTSDNSVWSSSGVGGTAAFAQQQWRAQITDSKKLAATVANLRKNGAGDRFIAEILNSEDPLAAAQMFNKQTKSGMRQSQSLFLSASRATASAANSTSAIYADEQRKSTAQLRTANKRLASIEKAINRNHKAAEATRKKQSAAKAVSKGKRAQTRSKRG